MIHWFRTIDYCFRFSFYLLTHVNFLHFLDNDDRMSSKRRNLSALVFLIKTNIKYFFLLFFYRFRKYGATRTSQPFCNFKLNVFVVTLYS